MKVKQLMSQPVATCHPDSTLQEAAQIMWERDCGALPVVDSGGHLVGMITDRDICMTALFRRQPLECIPISSAMSKEVYACEADDSVDDAERQMRAARVRRLPVLESELRLVGLISINDLARAATSQPKNGDVTMSEVVNTLRAVCTQPRD